VIGLKRSLQSMPHVFPGARQVEASWRREQRTGSLARAVLACAIVGMVGCTSGVSSDASQPRGAASGGEGAAPGPGSGGSGGAPAGSAGGSAIDQRDPGRVVARRLNVTEYNNTVHDLFNSDIKLPSAFPPDDSAYGFDNVAQALNVTDIHVGYYLANAKLISAEALTPTRRAALVKCDVATLHEACVQDTLQSLLPRAWRRPTTADEVNRLVSVYSKNKLNGSSDDESLGRVIQAVLLAPEFLFRIEYGQGAEPRPLDGYEMASRLAYFLWSSMPDDELFAAASANKLSGTEDLKAQVARMLKDPKAAALRNFGEQWLPVRSLQDVRPDATVFPSWDEGLRSAMQLETTLLFSDVVSGALPINQLLTANYGYINDRLARHYGLPLVGSTTPVRTQMPEGRGGILTQGSWLTVMSHPNETAPVLRGKWILNQLMCVDIAPPPPDVPQEPTAIAGQSRRERLKAHRTQPVCNACHGLMDPFGLGLEQYDGVGAYRTSDLGAAIDPAGTMPDGSAFSTPREMAQLLATNPEFSRCVTQRAFVYGLGRADRLDSMDTKIIDDAAQALVSGGQKFPALLESLIISDAFRQRQDVQN
jgi:Protein of unknown function (DUF1592)/Protein of unknown function (DUF1588)/Protein of unknown function (DUF1587)/Protein of unknown function (DUF1595)/Protein of unknown function (DUF1585)